MSWPRLDESSAGGFVPFVMFNPDSRELEIHLLGSKWAKNSEKDGRKFARFIKNLMLTF